MIPLVDSQLKNNNLDQKLVGKARVGHKESLDRLVEIIQPQLAAHLYRSTLDAELADDITQETILEIYDTISKLRKLNLFWPWVRQIAINKLRQYYKIERRQRHILNAEVANNYLGQRLQNGEPDGMGKLMNMEMKQFIVSAMKQLKPDHRQIINLRCFEAMDYLQISESMGCTDFGARVLFFRAKRALQKQLARQGLGKSSLVLALIAFAKMTAPANAAATQVAVTGSSLNVGITAAVVGYFGVKTSFVAAIVLGLIGIGGISLLSTTSQDSVNGANGSGENASIQVSQLKMGSYERWVYYPEGSGGPVAMRSSTLNSDSTPRAVQWLQNDHANYLFAEGKVAINNFRTWNGDYSVRRLPTDSASLTEFLNHVEGRTLSLTQVPDRSGDLLVISRYSENEDVVNSESTYLDSALKETYFKYGQVAGTDLVDHRDPPHRQGWTGFQIQGTINGKKVEGSGRIPFVYRTLRDHAPWLQIDLPDGNRVVETTEKSVICNNRGEILRDFAPGTFFSGISRPWSGLHSLDTVRRDAAEQFLWFETLLSSDDVRVQVAIKFYQQGVSGELRFEIDMERDFVQKISLISEKHNAEIEIDYLQSMAAASIAAPKIRSNGASKRRGRADPGLFWIAELGESLGY
jgi:RNA polymerase sigma-70 factor (ECF subfamily)